MKWVHLGIAQAALFVAVAAYVDRQHRSAIIAGGVTAGGLMYGQYAHAKRAGLANGGAPTETYGSTGGRASWAKG